MTEPKVKPGFVRRMEEDNPIMLEVGDKIPDMLITEKTDGQPIQLYDLRQQGVNNEG